MNRVIFSVFFSFFDRQTGRCFISVDQALYRNKCRPSPVVRITKFNNCLILIIILHLFSSQDNLAIIFIRFFKQISIRSRSGSKQIINPQFLYFIGCCNRFFILLVIQTHSHFKCQCRPSCDTTRLFRCNIQVSICRKLIQFIQYKFNYISFGRCRYFGFFQCRYNFCYQRNISIGCRHHIISPGTKKANLIPQLFQPVRIFKRNFGVFGKSQEIITTSDQSIIKPSDSWI